MHAWEASRATARRSPLATLAEHDVRSGSLVASAVVGVGLLAWLDLALTGRLGPLFGTGFVLVALTCATAADARSLFAPGVLPPLLLVGAVWVVAIVAPEGIAVDGLSPTAGTLQRVIAGIVDHATALVVGHLAALGVVAARIVAAARVRPDPQP